MGKRVNQVDAEVNTAHLSLFVSPRFKDEIDSAATNCGVSRSEYIRRAIVAKMQADLKI